MMQSQEKKAGDRLSVPNIDDTINVQLNVDGIPCNSKQGDGEDVLDDSPRTSGEMTSRILVTDSSVKKQSKKESNDP